jgi:RNA polymerase sigma-70 factor, ECF subfamily
MGDTPPKFPGTSENLESTANLLARARLGDERARDALFARYIPALKRLARGRLPYAMRDLSDTDDLVQDTLVQAFKHLETFEPRHEGSFLAYLRQIVINQIRQEIRKMARRPRRVELVDGLPDHGRTPLDDALGRETLDQYDEALSKLTDERRQAVILRIEFGYSYEEVAKALNRPTADAARMVISRALVRLAELMGKLGASNEQ